ncbi:MAG: hypothetical protein R2932_45990 [Caldilineaceae bacterium]
MAYRELNETTILAYAKTRPALVPLLAPLGEITAREIGDGNLNTVYILESTDQPGQAS